MSRRAQGQCREDSFPNFGPQRPGSVKEGPGAQGEVRLAFSARYFSVANF